MATPKIDKYADYQYKIQSETELEEAKWLISIGSYKDLDDYIDSYTKSEKKYMKQRDAEREKRLALRKRRRNESKNTA